MYIPNLPTGTYRAFEISGDSMLPMPSGSLVISKYVETLKDVKDDKTYVIITHRWVDMRRYGRLGQLPIDRAGDDVWEQMPRPVTEVQ